MAVKGVVGVCICICVVKRDSNGRVVREPGAGTGNQDSTVVLSSINVIIRRRRH